ncbi:MAG TPA: response regulator [Candidatus Deferrimicrobiaceae bacterium]|jgi:signal transduction histidine kinase
MAENAGNNNAAVDRGNKIPDNRLGISLVVLFWTICMIASVAWNFRDKREQIQGLALVEARAIMMKDLVYRRWVSDHGGVYVPFGGETIPNPRLSHLPGREVVTSSGIRLILVNPEYMMRQVYELADMQGGARGHVTSLNPILPENGADPWESRALKAFQLGEKEVSSVDLLDGEPFMRLMRPLVTEKRCMDCHGQQGYKVGDIRGGISVSVPMEPYKAVAEGNIRDMFLGHGGIWLVGMALLGAGSSVIRRQQKQREGVKSVLDAERDRVEEVTRRETALRNVLLDNLPCIALVISKETREIVACNEIAKKCGAVVGKTCYDALAVPGSPCPFCRAPELWETGESRQLETEYMGRFWQGIWVPFSDDYYVHYIFEITDRKRAEEDNKKLEAQLQQAVKMEAVGRLAGGVAHDFNNLLTAIMGNISLAQMRLPSSDIASVRLAEAGKAAERAAGLTQKLLAFSRKQIIEPKVLDLNELIADLHSMLVRLIREDIEIRYVPGEGLGMVKVDASQFEQVLVNLVVNARDAMPGGGKIVIETSNAALDDDYRTRHPYVKRAEQFVMLAVSDTGCGMSEQVKSHLFEPFFTTKPKGAGTGLGLAMVYGSVKQAGGSIEVYSEVGIGTTFKIYLPGTGEKPGDSGAMAAANPPGGCETVLVVEDEDLVRNLWIEALEGLGYNVVHASNGNAAVETAKAHGGRIDLLLTDIVMPGINGRELAEKLRRIHPEMKVLFTSGYTENAVVHQGILDEGVDFIGKPFSPPVLAKKIREVLERG